MKRLGLLIMLGTMVAGLALAQPSDGVKPLLKQGTRQISVGGSLDDNGEDIGLFLSARGGYFVMDNAEVGVGASAGTRGDFKSLGVAAFGEYNIPLGGPLVPYAGASAGLAWADTGIDDNTYLECAIWGGARFFFIDYAAIGCDLAILVATDDVYNGGEDAFDWVLRLNTSWFF